MTKIKICGLSRDCDIDYVNEAEPDYIGFILNFPKSRRNISPERAAGLKKKLKNSIRAVGVFVNQPMDAVLEAADTIGLDVIQLHGNEDDNYIEELRKKTDREIWKAFKIRSVEDLLRAEKSTADRILLDNGYGTGEAFDWSLAGGLTPETFMLAGGLTPENIPEAVSRLHPLLVDISSGVETDGYKDREKILRAVHAARQAR